MKCLNFIALTWILVWKSSVKLFVMTERRQKQGFVFFINKESFSIWLNEWNL